MINRELAAKIEELVQEVKILRRDIEQLKSGTVVLPSPIHYSFDTYPRPPYPWDSNTWISTIQDQKPFDPSSITFYTGC